MECLQLKGKKYIIPSTYKNRDGHIRDGYSLEVVKPDEFFNGSMLKDALSERRLPTYSFANFVAKHPIQIERYIKGTALPPLDIFRRMCIFLQIDPVEALNMKIVEIIKRRDL